MILYIVFSFEIVSLRLVHHIICVLLIIQILSYAYYVSYKIDLLINAIKSSVSNIYNSVTTIIVSATANIDA